MHMADALVSPAVAVTMYAASAAAAGVSLVQLHKEETAAPELAKKKLPTMAVMSALVFAGQMINYTIPGTGSSGHLCGGMLLSAILGPWAGFLSMIVILAIQALFFADGGGVHHVAMYLGDGYYVEAPHTGDVVKITAMNDKLPDFAKRVVDVRGIDMSEFSDEQLAQFVEREKYLQEREQRLGVTDETLAELTEWLRGLEF